MLSCYARNTTRYSRIRPFDIVKVRLPSPISCGGRSSTRMAAASAIQQSDSPYIDKDFTLKGEANGSLAGKTFAVKDMFPLAGHTTGFGNPTWQATHKPAEATCPSVQALLNAGATVKGITHMDEIAWSLQGENHHYGTPRNPAAPDRIPGGSSSGSASAVAAGHVDFALGSDTGGSVRVPSSFTGILGIRPTHGRVSLQGSPPLGESFDTCGWFSKSSDILSLVGSVLLDKSEQGNQKIKRWLVATDCFALADKNSQEATFKVVKTRRADFDRVLGTMEEVEVCPQSAGVGTLKDWLEVFRIIQAAEGWQAMGDWYQKEKPELGPGTKERMEGASKLSQAQWDEAKAKRKAIIEHLTKLLGNDAVLVLPTTPGPAPLLGLGQDEMNVYRARMLQLTSVAGNGQLPQVNIPCGTVDDAPIGLGIVGPSGSDETLLDIAKQLYPLR